jgi:rRNA maturation endonuclease Nob1
MSNWVLECSNCQTVFTHSMIDETKMLSYFLPLKPAFPPSGSQLECPHCGSKATYQRTDLRYQA